MPRKKTGHPTSPDTMTDSEKIEFYIRELRKRATGQVADGYARISKNPNTGEMEKTDRQLAHILKKIYEHGRKDDGTWDESKWYRLGEIHRDDNISAYRKGKKRPGFEAMLARATNGDCDVVVCWHMDRLVRQPLDLEKLIDLAEKGFTVESCLGLYNMKDRTGRLALRVLVAFFCAESEANSERQIHKYNAKRQEGHKHSGGHRAIGHPGITKDASGNRRPITAQELERERELFRRGVHARLNGASLNTIVNMWNDAGILTPRGLKWTTSTVRVTFRLARHAGLFEHDGQIIGTASNVVPIITPDQFYALRALHRGARKGRAVSHPLSGVIVCAECGYGMGCGTQKQRASSSSYKCPTPYNRQASCGRTYISKLTVEKHVRELVLDRLTDPEHARMMAMESAELATIGSELETWTTALNNVAQEFKKLQGTQHAMTIQEWRVMRDPIVEHIRELELKRDALVKAGANETRRVREREELEMAWDEATADEQRRLTKKAFPYGLEILPRPAGMSGKKIPVSTRVRERQSQH